jgi:nitroreductase
MDLFKALHTQRAIRSFKPDPVPDDLLHKVLDAAIRAPSGGNSQQWVFLVLKDPKVKRRIGAIYREIFTATGMPAMANDPDPSRARVYRTATELAQHMGQAPVLILACVRKTAYSSHVMEGSSIYPAVQNLMLAARGLGLGTVITTVHRLREAEIKEILGIPDEMDTAALIPLGFPADGARFGPTTRRPVEEVAFLDHWGTPVFPGARPD